MSNIAVQGGATGTGTVTLLAPSTSTNRTLTLPDSAGTVATAESTLTQFNATGSAPVYACRAWVNFNGTGTVAIRASGNVSSITDNGTGSYSVNFTNSMPDANASAVTGTGFNEAGGVNALGTLISASKADIYTYSIAGGGAGSYQDTAQVSLSVFR